MRFMTLVVALTVGTACVAAARAQSRMAVGVEAGALHGFDQSVFQLGLRATPARGGYGSVDFAFATIPDLLFDGALVFLMDLGITYGAPSDSSPVYVFPHGGVSLGAAGSLSGSGGGGAVAGYNVGAGLLLSASPSLGFSLDYTYRRFTSGQVPVSSITIGLMFLP
ncbi:MAG TPA: hypothetical protein VGU74_00150 [Gemmatimonadales bacterium]|nr:hypothetical protein [Gemmatimonadales bacterium]